MASVKRPLSPHLQVYKPQLTSLLSITHRATGVFLSIGTLLFSCWLIAIAGGAEAYASFQNQITSWYGQVVLIAFLFSLYYHLCNGIRHLFWDAGLGLEIRTTYISGYAVIAVSVLLTIITWLAGGAA